MINIDPAMENGTETVMVGDGADCTLSIKNVTSGKVLYFHSFFQLYNMSKENKQLTNSIAFFSYK